MPAVVGMPVVGMPVVMTRRETPPGVVMAGVAIAGVMPPRVMPPGVGMAGAMGPAPMLVGDMRATTGTALRTTVQAMPPPFPLDAIATPATGP